MKELPLRCKRLDLRVVHIPLPSPLNNVDRKNILHRKSSLRHSRLFGGGGGGCNTVINKEHQSYWERVCLFDHVMIFAILLRICRVSQGRIAVWLFFFFPFRVHFILFPLLSESNMHEQGIFSKFLTMRLPPLH